MVKTATMEVPATFGWRLPATRRRSGPLGPGKALFDRVVAALLLGLLAVPMGLIALAVKASSRGPVFYRQVRLGLDGRPFVMLKFRSMVEGAEALAPGAWTLPNDPRCTPVGRWLRRTSLDELPQLINVLRGEMSLVGPRPEQPHLARRFARRWRHYDQRHRVKAGMTGWAQIHDLRGRSPLKRRLLYDLVYVRRWSFALDLWILLRTPWHLWTGRHAY